MAWKHDIIRIWVTGGTLDNEKRTGARPTEKKVGKLLDEPLTPKAVKEIIEKIKTDYPKEKFPEIICEKYEIYKDSNEFVKGDIRRLAYDMIRSGYKNNIVTHGTDCLKENAIMLDKLLKESNRPEDLKDVVALMTGALTPLANGPESDAYMNLEYSIRKLADNIINHGPGNREQGVFISMDQMILDPNKVRKDFSSGKFVMEKPVTHVNGKQVGAAKKLPDTGEKIID